MQARPGGGEETEMAMGIRLSRRRLAVATLAGVAAPASAATQDQGTQQPPEPERDYPAPKFQPRLRKPRLGATLVQDFVIFAHGDLDMVKRLLEKEPALLNATVDWGGGDWESGLGGAAHMGRRDIALLLIERGARIDLFAAAMLGHLDAVRAALAAHPGLINARGPHGIPLLAHAKAGGKEAEPVLSFLEELAAKAAAGK
jgi:hypothetical protein